MYICEKCKRQIAPGVPQFKEVVETRIAEDKHGEEIVREINVCPACVEVNNGSTEE